MKRQKSLLKNIGTNEKNRSRIYQTIRKPKEAIAVLDIKLMPPDAMAFYRPFHFYPFEDWGIYLIIPRILKYFENLFKSFSKLAVYTVENLAVAVLFEIFHHEFFHHLVESTATTMEIIYKGLGHDRCFYLDYLKEKGSKSSSKEISCEPLEEALANAYAYNSFSFISRVKSGYVSGIVKIYQEVMEKYWRFEPSGYRDAGNYIKGGQIYGGAKLLAKLIGYEMAVNDLPLEKLSSCVFPSGYTAFIQKPDIPTYLVGDQTELDLFYKLIPAPNESYTNLFWPANTAELDNFIKEKRKEEREAKKRQQEQGPLF